MSQDGKVGTATAYPYTGLSKGVCHFKPSAAVQTNVSGYANITVGDEEALLAAVAAGGVVPAGINSDADAFMFYSGGILDIPAAKCASGPGDLDHVRVTALHCTRLPIISLAHSLANSLNPQSQPHRVTRI